MDPKFVMGSLTMVLKVHSIQQFAAAVEDYGTGMYQHTHFLAGTNVGL